MNVIIAVVVLLLCGSLRGVAGQSESERAQAMQALFKDLDRDGDGEIEKEEALSFIASVGDGAEYSNTLDASSAWEQMKKQLDGSDQGENISPQELKERLEHISNADVKEWVLHGLEMPQYVGNFDSVEGLDLPELLLLDQKEIQAEFGINNPKHAKQLMRYLQRRVWGIGRPPGAPQGARCVHDGVGIDVHWKPTEDPGYPPLHSYVVMRRRTSKPVDTTWHAVGSTASDIYLLDDASADPEASYLYRIAAWNRIGKSLSKDVTCGKQGGASSRGDFWGGKEGRWLLFTDDKVWDFQEIVVTAVSGVAAMVLPLFLVLVRVVPQGRLPAWLDGLMGRIAGDSSGSGGAAGAAGGERGLGQEAGRSSSGARVKDAQVRSQSGGLAAGRTRSSLDGQRAGLQLMKPSDSSEGPLMQLRRRGTSSSLNSVRSRTGLADMLSTPPPLGGVADSEQPNAVGSRSRGLPESMLPLASMLHDSAESRSAPRLGGAEALEGGSSQEDLDARSEPSDGQQPQIQAVQHRKKSWRCGFIKEDGTRCNTKLGWNKHYCELCQAYVCLPHTGYACHNPSWSRCNSPSTCLCLEHWNRLAPEQRAELERHNKAPRTAENGSRSRGRRATLMSMVFGGAGETPPDSSVDAGSAGSGSLAMLRSGSLDERISGDALRCGSGWVSGGMSDSASMASLNRLSSSSTGSLQALRARVYWHRAGKRLLAVNAIRDASRRVTFAEAPHRS